MKKIAFYANPGKAAEGTIAALRDCAAKAGLEVADGGSGSAPDAVVALGGDGTVLAAVREFPGVPLLGLNLGSLGFLAAVDEPHFAAAIEALAQGRYRIAMRTALSAEVVRPDGAAEPLPDALNDVVVSRDEAGRVACFELNADGSGVTSFMADGLIIATPTGSTAYSLAAGGPVLMPDSSAIAVTPICPHALASRPVVMPESTVLEVRAVPKSDSSPVPPLSVAADGRTAGAFSCGDVLRVRKAERAVPFVELEGCNPYEVISRKLGWSGQFRISGGK